MTCCVAINAKEGDCWIQLINCVLSLMLHKCHISHQTESVELKCLAQQLTESTEFRWSAKQFTESIEHSLRLHYKVSSYRAHSGIEGF